MSTDVKRIILHIKLTQCLKMSTALQYYMSVYCCTPNLRLTLTFSDMNLWNNLTCYGLFCR